MKLCVRTIAQSYTKAAQRFIKQHIAKGFVPNFVSQATIKMQPEQELQSILAHSFEIDFPETISKEKIIEVLSWRVDKLIEGNPDKLFSMLYRLDISEKKIKDAMASENEVTKKIAVLIYERQLEKIISRRHFTSDTPEDDLAW